MSAYRSTIAIAVFQSDGDAKNAIDALRDAGFQRDQIGLAWHQGGAANINYLNDLVSLGISQERLNVDGGAISIGKRTAFCTNLVATTMIIPSRQMPLKQARGIA